MNCNTIKVPQFQPLTDDTLKERESFFPMLHGKATDSIARMAGSQLIENRINDTGILDTGEVKLVVDKLTKLAGTLGVSTHKLLSTAITIFTQLNQTGNTDRKVICTAIKIPLKEYALRCGYKVQEQKAETKSEIEKETKRVKGAMDNARKKIRKDLTLLFFASLSWKEKVRGKQEDFMDIRLIEAKGIRNGYIHIRFTQTFAEYLINLPITQYPVALLRVDERNNNAYNIGLKMSEHYNLDNNQIKGTSQLLKVKTLLAITKLPHVENIRKQKKLWEERIKEPFENSLDTLTACGLLDDWEYSKSKGKTMTDSEATSFSKYEEWSETLIKFTLKNTTDRKPKIKNKTKENKVKKTKKYKLKTHEKF